MFSKKLMLNLACQQYPTALGLATQIDPKRLDKQKNRRHYSVMEDVIFPMFSQKIDVGSGCTARSKEIGSIKNIKIQ